MEQLATKVIFYFAFFHSFNSRFRLYDLIVSELDLLSLKHGGSSIDAYDFISTLGSGLKKHTETLTQQLQVFSK